MHITVYGISDNVDRACRIDSDSLSFEDSFVAGHYDWWKNIETTDGEIAEDFVAQLGLEPADVRIGSSKAGTYIVFKKNAIDKYFRRMWKGFRAALDKLNATTERDIRSYFTQGFSEMEATLDDTWGCMIYTYCDGWESLQDFMRRVEPRKHYYITGAVDAHW